MKLYIGNLPYSSTEAELREFLSEFEPFVDFYFPLDKYSGDPRGFAFVTLSNREGGEEAIRRLDGADFGGRNLRVNEAQDRAERPSGGGGYRDGGDRRGGGGGDRDRGNDRGGQRHRGI